MARRQPSPDRIVPDGFREAWGAETLEEALRTAEAAPSSTPREEMSRCPRCLSTKVRWESGLRKCDECGKHDFNPLPAPAEFDVQRPICPECGGPRLRTQVRGGLKCDDCGARPETAARGEFLDNPIMSDSRPRPTSDELPTTDDLRRLREPLELGGGDLAPSGTTWSAVRSWEAGETSPSLDRLASVLEYYHVVDGVRRAERLAEALPDEVADPFGGEAE